MILISLNLTELAAGQQALNEFNRELEHAWMPGFSRSYERRQELYRKAYQRYEERNLFLRLLFRKPKQPQQPPAGYSEQLTLRLQQDWLDSLQPASKPAYAGGSAPPLTKVTTQSFLDFLAGFLDDRFFALADLQTDQQMTADVLVAGPSGIWLFALDDGHGRPPPSPHNDNQHPSSQASWEHTSAAITVTLQSTTQLNPAATAALLPLKGGVILSTDQQQSQSQAKPPAAVRYGRHDDCRRWLEEPSAGDDIDQLTILQTLDSLQSRHQELQQLNTVSALATAQKLMKREKDQLLRLAATL